MIFTMTEKDTNIRAIRAAETHFLADMLYEAIFIPEGHEPLPREVINDPALSKYFENWGKDLHDVALVVEVDNELVGAIWGRLLTGDSRGFGYVDEQTPELSMAVKSEWRNKGLGTELILEIASHYRKMGVEQLSLSVDKANAATHLYQRLGCEIVDETETSWTMTKRILE